MSPPQIEDARGVQANERTLLAWLRTGVSLITFGFVIAKLGLRVEVNPAGPPTAVARWVGGAFVLLGAATEVIGTMRYLVVRRALLAARPVPVGATDVLALASTAAVLGLVLACFVLL